MTTTSTRAVRASFALACLVLGLMLALLLPARPAFAATARPPVAAGADTVLDCAWRSQQALAVLDAAALGWRGAPAHPGALGPKEIKTAAAGGAQGALAARPMVSGLHGCGTGNRALVDAIDEARSPLPDAPSRASWLERNRFKMAQRDRRSRDLDDALAVKMRALQAPRALTMLDAEIEWRAAESAAVLKVMRPQPQVVEGRLALCSVFMAAGSSPDKPANKPHCMVLRNVRVDAEGSFRVALPAAAGADLAALPPSERRLWLRTSAVIAPEPMQSFDGRDARAVDPARDRRDGTVEVADAVELLFTTPLDGEGREQLRASAPFRPARGATSVLAAEQRAELPPAVRDDTPQPMRLAPPLRREPGEVAGPLRVDLAR